MSQPPPSAVRAWARARGFPVGDRGRLSPSLVALYLTEHPASGSAPERPAGGQVSPAASTAPRRGTTVRARGPWNWPTLEGEQPAPARGKGRPPAR